MALVTVNAGGLPEGTFESEIFGHVKGAFTDARMDRVGRFELASGGTLFLDEIANVPMRQQAKLLRVLETGELSGWARRKRGAWMCACCAPPMPFWSTKQRRATSRRSAVPHQHGGDSPAGAARQARDIPLLAAHFLARNRTRYRKQVSGFRRRQCRC